jgi:hypothetical protein|nr:MAG TPA: hypothetical protein [Caudoviricetes sp.]
MDDFLKFFDEKSKTYPMHLEIEYNKTCDWSIFAWRKMSETETRKILYVESPDMELCFAKAHVALKEWLLKVEGGY